MSSSKTPIKTQSESTKIDKKLPTKPGTNHKIDQTPTKGKKNNNATVPNNDKNVGAVRRSRSVSSLSKDDGNDDLFKKPIVSRSNSKNNRNFNDKDKGRGTACSNQSPSLTNNRNETTPKQKQKPSN